MKKLMNKSRMIMAIAIMVTFTLASAQSFAGNIGDNPVELKYVGNTNNQPVFLLNFNNSEADEFVVMLKDDAGYVLYSEKVEGKQISRKYRLNTEEVDGNIFIEVSSKKSGKTIYTVNRKSRVVEDVVVNKLL